MRFFFMALTQVFLIVSMVQARPVVVIDPGHGGAATGCEGYYGVYEKAVTLSIALLVRKYLEKQGIDVVMTRWGDWDLPLHARADVANIVHAACFVSIHCNASLSLKPQGIETYTYGNGSNEYEPDQMFDMGKAPIESVIGTEQALENYGLAMESHVLALSIQQSLVQGLKPAIDRGVRQARYAVLHYNRRPAVVAEVGFLTNEKEGKRLLDPNYQDHVARLLAKGISLFLDRQKTGALRYLIRRRIHLSRPGLHRPNGHPRQNKTPGQSQSHENQPGFGLSKDKARP